MGVESKQASVIGICGGIGSGKSIFSKLLSFYGIPVFDCDAAAKKVYRNPSLRDRFEEIIGASLFLIGGELNKQALSKVVFGDSGEAKTQLSEIINGDVLRQFEEWKSLQRSVSYVGLESGILYTSHYSRLCKFVIFVDAPEELRMQRVEQRNGLASEQVLERINAQRNEILLARRSADFEVSNDGSQSLILEWEAIAEKIGIKKGEQTVVYKQ